MRDGIETGHDPSQHGPTTAYQDSRQLVGTANMSEYVHNPSYASSLLVGNQIQNAYNITLPAKIGKRFRVHAKIGKHNILSGDIL